MINRVIFFLFCLTFTLSQSFAYADNNKIGINRVAVTTTWPETYEKYSYEVLFHNIVINLPNKVKRISGVEDSLIVYNEDGSIFHISAITYSDLFPYKNTRDMSGDREISVSMAGQIPFEKTFNDPIPANPNDALIWKDALNSKREIFGNNNSVFKSEKEGVRVYFYESPVPPFGNYASIHKLNIQDNYIFIAGINLNFEEFRKIIGSIRTLN